MKGFFTMPAKDRSDYMRVYQKQYAEKNALIKFYVSNNDYKHIKSIADVQKVSVPTLAKQSLYAQARNLYLQPKEMSEAKKSELQEIRKIGTNINQIAKVVNQHKFASPELMQSLLSNLKELDDIIRNS